MRFDLKKYCPAEKEKKLSKCTGQNNQLQRFGSDPKKYLNSRSESMNTITYAKVKAPFLDCSEIPRNREVVTK